MNDRQPSHPLDPLTPAEINLAAEVIRNRDELSQRILFEQVRLLEPEKAVVRAYVPGNDMDRQGFAVVLDRDSGRVYEAVVSLANGNVESFKHIPDVQICVTGEECEELVVAVKSDPDFIAGLEKRGIRDNDQVSVEFFAIGNFAARDESHLRLCRAHCFFVEKPGDNPHVRPIEGLVPVVDLNSMAVLRVEDYGVVPVPPDLGDYQAERLDHIDPPLAKLDITQPEGPGFEVDGFGVRWQNWKFRVGFTPREGLVLHTLSFIEDGKERPVVYRASLSELVVPYGDIAGDHGMNHSFDLGEGVFGRLVNSLKLGCDCLGEIYYFDVDLADAYGNPVHHSHAVCMHEEDYGILWKHTDGNTGKAEVRRSRRLVVSSFFTVGNYDYGLFWYLYLDGTIQFEAKLTGMLYTRAIPEGEETIYGALVAPGLNAMVHEHYFNIRLDMSVEGEANTVVEVEAERIPGGEINPLGNAHKAVEAVIREESESGRNICPGNGRYWKVINPSLTNNLGWHPGYKLVPGPNVRPMHQPGSPFMRRAGFVEHDLWVTAYDPDEIHAPGQYVNQNELGGLPEWVKANRPLENTDVVLWHTVGLLHIPRPEDYPVMPVEYTGFMLKPIGFFERNPALHLAPSGCLAKIAQKQSS